MRIEPADMKGSCISICICTFRRPQLLARLLDALGHLRTDSRLTYSIVVADNDSEQSAQSTVLEFTRSSGIETTYCVEPVQNIALARNRAVANAQGDFIAFIDDDEIPGNDWLLDLFNVCQLQSVDGVLGPVLPHYTDDVPQWYRKAGFYDFRKRHPTGFKLDWPECRTGNVLLRRSVLDSLPGPFLEKFGTGGEDQDFFRRAIEQGRVFVWCDEAIAYESIPPSRYQRRVLLGRALLRGKNSFKHAERRGRNILKSLVAAPFYLLALPLLLLAGQHHFMKYLAKLTAHAGLLLACVGLNPMNERQM
jgi:glycosyltransferase involved in cell wall biosynthesis